MKFHSLALSLLLGAAPAVLMAQPTPPPASEGADDPDIIVTAAQGYKAERGAVIGDIKPELQLGPADIRSYGVSSINDLLSELAPQTTSGRGGQPVVLLNAKRISGMNEIRDIPTEAIARVDILPEEVALKYGYTADQKVVNIVLRQRFRAYTGELDGGAATEGGALTGTAEADYLRIRKDTRLNVDLKYTDSAALFEDERNIMPTPSPYTLAGNLEPGSPPPLSNAAVPSDLRPYRTLSPATTDFTANATYNRSIFGTVSATFNTRLEVTTSRSDNGLPTLVAPVTNGTVYRYITALGPLTQDTRGTTGHFGLVLNGDITHKWHWSVTGNYDIADSRTTSSQSAVSLVDSSTDPTGTLTASAFNPNPNGIAHSLTNTAAADLLFYGPLLRLPAGEVSTSIKGAVTNSLFDNSNSLFPNPLPHISQTEESGQINLDVPIAKADKDVLKLLGDLTLNANAGVQHYSDFGTLTTFGYGLNWNPVDPLTLIASFTTDHTAPSVNQLDNPQVTTLNTIITDPLTGETVTVNSVTGGNPTLAASTRHVMKLEANYKPWQKTDLTFNITFTRSNVNNPIATPTLIDAFQDIEGNNVNFGTIDQGPINFARTESDQLRLGINFSKPIKSNRKPPPGGWAALFGNRRPGGGDGPRPDGDHPRGAGGGRGGFGGGQQGGGRLQVALYDTIFLHDTVLVAAGGPQLDLLRGGETGTNGGQPRHQVQLQAGITKDGFGARVSANWQSATTVINPVSADDLHFGSLGTANLRLFVNLGQQFDLIRAHPWLRGTRLTFSVNNLFDARQNVTAPDGSTPLSYQPAYLDATGRTFKISIRKLFF